MLQTSKIFSQLFEKLSDRQKDVVTKRFGLDNQKPQTLEAIGQTYDVTRERVRQIEVVAISLLKSRVLENGECAELFRRGQKYLKSVGGVAPREDMLREYASFVQGLTGNHLALLIVAAHPFYAYEEDEKFRPFYYLDKESLRNAQDAISSFVRTLKDRKDAMLSGEYEIHLASFIKRERVPVRHFQSHLAVTKRIMRNPYNDVGLEDWPTINAKTIRDKIYLALKKSGKPEHFNEITNLINKAGFAGRKALAPTVHNELIKDKRFVLVGRGVYGLAEHGYEPGIARDVIKRILKREGPMRLPEIITAVQKERTFRPNTVLANLQNRQYFERLKDGNYRIREA